MPSPFSHAAAGLVTSWIADIVSPSPKAPGSGTIHAIGGKLSVAAAILAAAPDADLAIADTHRTFTHSFVSAGVVGVVALYFAARRRLPVRRTGLVCGLAWASHVLLDWLGSDRSIPQGVMALWPFDHAFYRSSVTIFPTVEHRVWLVELFLRTNAMAFVSEVVVMGPLVALVWSWRRQVLARQGNHAGW